MKFFHNITFCFSSLSYACVVLCQAQSLHGPITTASRLSESDHHLYIITESQANK